MSDQIVVMRDGKIEQAGTPEQVYEEPLTVFVANFVGESNLLEGTVTDIDERAGGGPASGGSRLSRAAPRRCPARRPSPGIGAPWSDWR